MHGPNFVPSAPAHSTAIRFDAEEQRHDIGAVPFMKTVVVVTTAAVSINRVAHKEQKKQLERRCEPLTSK